MSDFQTQQQAHRVAFGKAITIWMKSNGWSQQVPDDFGKAVGQPGPHNSQISQIQNGKLDPKTNFWVCLGEFNRAVAEKDLKAIKTRSLLDRLHDADAFRLDNGIAATAIDFFGMFIGAAPIPAAYRPKHAEMSEDAVAAANDLLRKHFLAGAWARNVDPEKAMRELIKIVALPTKERPRLRKVLAGWDQYTAEELADGTLMAAMHAWAEKA